MQSERENGGSRRGTSRVQEKKGGGGGKRRKIPRKGSSISLQKGKQIGIFLPLQKGGEKTDVGGNKRMSTFNPKRRTKWGLLFLQRQEGSNFFSHEGKRRRGRRICDGKESAISRKNNNESSSPL